MLTFVSASTQEIVSVSNYTPTLAGTISFWLYNTTTSGTKGIICCPSGTFNQSTFRISQDTSAPVITIKMNRSATLNGTTSLVVGTLYFVTVTWQDVAGTTTQTLFINAVQEATSSGTTQSQTAAPFHMGSYNTGINYWDGSLQDVRVYDRVLALDEIQTIFACRGIDAITFGLHYRLRLVEKQSGATATGASSVVNIGDSQNDFTPSGSPTYSDCDLKLRRRV